MNSIETTDPKDLDWFNDPDPERALSKYLKGHDNHYNRATAKCARSLIPASLPANARVLDYGCGGGEMTVWLARQGWDVTALDASSCSLGACRLHLEREGLADQVRTLHGQPPDYWSALKSETFDVIVAKDVIEHIDDDIGFLRELRSHLTPEGTAVVVTQNDASWNYWAQAREGFASDPAWCGWDETHVRFYNPPALAGKLIHAGLTPLKWRSAYLIPYRDWSWRGGLRGKLTRALAKMGGTGVFHWPERLFGGFAPLSRLGWSMAVVCRRDDSDRS